MCVVVRIVVAAPTPERQMALRRAAPGVEWEVVAAVADADQAVALLKRLHAQVLILDAETTGADAADLSERLQALSPPALLVGVGDLRHAHAHIASERLEDLHRVLTDLLHDTGDHMH
jgi:DNA-binding NarL/FixJ family response regulator